MGWRKATYEVMTEDGIDVVTGVRNGPLAVRRVCRRSGYLWKIEHLPSGLSFGAAVGLHGSEASARAAAEEMLRLNHTWERQNWYPEGTEERELQRALARRIRTALER